ncbi:hypothetical protein MKX08_001353 [Trichoderma sp. CBMAI-0020]|nr:hypothetical protein MKX08_001353 [Trichoderma sp. CBMAI-0020]
MGHDIETAPDAIDRQDQPSEENASQNQGPDKSDLDKSIRAVIYANTADYSSTRPESVASARLQNAVRERQSYELPPDSIPVSAPELARAGTFASIQRRHTDAQSDSPGRHKAPDVQSFEYDIPRRANTFGIEADDESIAKFLVQHLSDDIFSLDVHQTPVASFSSLLKCKTFNIKRLIKKEAEAEPRVTIQLSLAALNRMRMRRLQMKLSNRIMRMHYFEEITEDWETLLVQYIKATRDNDYIRTCVDRGLHDPFLIRSERKVDAAILDAELLRIPPEMLEKELLLQSVNGTEKFNLVPPLEQEPTAIGGTRKEMTRKQWTEGFLKRIVSSVIGGAFLVVPMWLMISLNSQRASLITTTVFVFVSGIVASYSLENPLAVVSTTAAYAAVLVVFVGTSSTPTSS